MVFEKIQYDFWKQKDPQPFEYTVDYKLKQSTNIEMSYLRLGWISNFLSIPQMKSMNVVDIGCGNRCFLNCVTNSFKNVYGYDVAGESISKHDLYTLEWDLIVLSDVLEHFEDINDLFKMKWKYAFISYPETPVTDSIEELSKWKHFKPDEHLWCLNEEGMKAWLGNNNCNVLGISNFEDIIRSRWDETLPNITSFFIENKKPV